MTTQPNDQYYCYDPDDGLVENDSAEAAEAAAEAVLDAYREQAGDGWAEEVEHVHWGRLLPLGVATQERIDDPESQERAREQVFDFLCDYHLASQPDELGLLRTEVASLRAAVIKLTAERDASLARAAIYESDGTGCVPVAGGRQNEVYKDGNFIALETSEAGEEVRQLRARVAELESPPVPEGWRVYRDIDYWVYTGPATEQAPPTLLRALAWAREHDKRPPHAADTEAAAGMTGNTGEVEP